MAAVELAAYDTQGRPKDQCVALDAAQRVSSPPWSPGWLAAGGWVTRNHWLRFFFDRSLFPTHSFAQGCHRKAWAGPLTMPTDRPVVVIARPTLLMMRLSLLGAI